MTDGISGNGRSGNQQALLAALKKIGTEKALDHAFRQSKNPEQFTKQMHTWFDAFRTLKLIHALRDHHLPNVSYAMLDADRIFRELSRQEPELMQIKYICK